MVAFRFLSRILPLFVYPLGLACVLTFIGLVIHNGRWQKVLLILVFLLLFLGGNRWITLGLAKSLEWRYSPPQLPLQADVIIVLASNNLPAEYPRAIPEVGEVGDRLIYAAYLYQQGVAPLIIHTGGNTRAGTPSLLEIMGVPPNAIQLETSSHDTYENAVACKKIIDEKDYQSIVLVTSAAHMPRAVAIFKHLGIDVIPAPTGYTATKSDTGFKIPNNLESFLEYILPNADNLKTTTRMVSEYFGIFIYKLMGRL